MSIHAPALASCQKRCAPSHLPSLHIVNWLSQPSTGNGQGFVSLSIIFQTAVTNFQVDVLRGQSCFALLIFLSFKAKQEQIFWAWWALIYRQPRLLCSQMAAMYKSVKAADLVLAMIESSKNFILHLVQNHSFLLLHSCLLSLCRGAVCTKISLRPILFQRRHVYTRLSQKYKIFLTNG